MLIKEIFERGFHQFQKIFSGSLEPQVDSLLSGNALQIFKHRLHKLHLINNTMIGAYKWNSWSILLHASNKNFEEKVRTELWRPIIDSANSLRGNPKRYQEWCQQAS